MTSFLFAFEFHWLLVIVSFSLSFIYITFEKLCIEVLLSFFLSGLFGLYCRLKNLFIYYEYVKICDLKHFLHSLCYPFTLFPKPFDKQTFVKVAAIPLL